VTERLDFAWVYDTTPLAAFRMMTRLEHLTEQARRLGQDSHQILELRERDSTFRFVSDRRVEPALAAWGPRFFSSRNLVRQTQVWRAPAWDGTRTYDLDVEIGGISIIISGGGGLAPVTASTTGFTMNLTLESSGRGAGHRLEGGVADALSRTFEAEHEFRLQWLARAAPKSF
jgi:Protein of unknown function (DUF2505)